MLRTLPLSDLWPAAASVTAGAAAGATVALEPRLAAIFVAAVLLVWALGRLGGAALAWFSTLVVVVPYYDAQQGFEGSFVHPALIAGLGLFAITVPWAWSAARNTSPLRQGPGTLLFAGTVAFLLALSAMTLGKDVLNGLAFFAGAAAFLAARRVGRLEDWCAAAAAGLAILLAMAGVAFLAYPEERLGYFTGYPILFAGLVVALLPLALAYLYPRSRLLSGLLAGASVAALILSQTRSAWLAAVILVLLTVALLVRFGSPRSVIPLVVAALAFAGLAVSNQALSTTLEDRFSENALTDISLTHRQSIYPLAIENFQRSPVVGAGAVGESREENARRTGIEAADNGFLALVSDLGALGLGVGLVPLVVAAWALRGMWRRRGASPPEVAVTLSLLGMLVVTVFFDTYYWLQSSLLMFGLAGVLSTRFARNGTPDVIRSRPRGSTDVRV